MRAAPQCVNVCGCDTGSAEVSLSTSVTGTIVRSHLPSQIRSSSRLDSFVARTRPTAAPTTPARTAARRRPQRSAARGDNSVGCSRGYNGPSTPAVIATMRVMSSDAMHGRRGTCLMSANAKVYASAFGLCKDAINRQSRKPSNSDFWRSFNSPRSLSRGQEFGRRPLRPLLHGGGSASPAQ